MQTEVILSVLYDIQAKLIFLNKKIDKLAEVQNGQSSGTV